MEALKRTCHQFRELYKTMTPSQRATLIVVPVLLVMAFGFLMFNDKSSSYVALSWGKVFTTEEVISAEQALRDAGLTEFRREGQRIMAPAAEVEQYNAALLADGSLPSDWASEWERKFEKSSLFTSKDQLQTMKDIALAKELRRVIRAVPEIEDASVIWARAKPRRWPRNVPNVTATVNVRPRRGREISMELVQSLRAAVANMVPDLKPEKVTIFNQATGKSYTADQEGDPFDSRLLSRIREFENLHQSKILEALSYIPDVLVTVNVEVDNLKRMIVREQSVDPKKIVTLQSNERVSSHSAARQPSSAEPGQVSNRPRELVSNSGHTQSSSSSNTDTSTVSAPSFLVTDKEMIAAMPKAVQVSVSIPKEYYEAVATKEGHSAGETDEAEQQFEQAVAQIETQVLNDVKATVKRHVPTGSPDEAINVSSFVRVERTMPEAEVPIADQVGHVVSEWGGTIGLGLFTLFAVWMMFKSMPKTPPIEETTTQIQSTLSMVSGDGDHEDEEVEEVNERERLHEMVRDHPELAAAVLTKWLRQS